MADNSVPLKMHKKWLKTQEREVLCGIVNTLVSSQMQDSISSERECQTAKNFTEQ